MALTFSSHGQRTIFRYRREEPGVVGDVVVGLPAEVSIFSIVGWRAGNIFTSDFGGTIKFSKIYGFKEQGFEFIMNGSFCLQIPGKDQNQKKKLRRI